MTTRLAIVGLGLLVVLGSPTLARARAKGGKQDVSIRGEIVDTFCYATMGVKGGSHKQCGIDCARKGIPVGLLDKKANIHILLPGKEKTALPDEVVSRMGETVTVTGHQHRKGGVAFLTVESVK